MSNPPPPGWEPPGGSSWPPPPPAGPGGAAEPVVPGAPGVSGGPGTPPPFVPPPPGAPMGPPGPGAPPPPKRGGGGALLAILIGGGLIVVLLIVLVVVVVASSGDDMSPKERLTAAANNVSTARTLKFKGSYGYGSTNLQGELLVTRGGRAGGQVSWNGQNVGLLAADDKIFIKAPKSYWQSKVSPNAAERLLKDGDQWGLVEDSDIRLNVERELTPSAIASELRQASTRYSIRESKAVVQGRKAVKITSLLTTFYVSDDEDAELLRYESTSAPRISADVTVQSPSASSSSISQLRRQMGELTDAIDTSKTPRNSGKPEFVKCDKGGQPCTVRVKVWSVRSGAPSVTIKVNFRLTSEQGGGRFYGECESTGVVTGLEDATVQCTISGGDWAKYGKDARRVWVSATPIVIAATASDVQTMQRNLDSE